jgi:hypothetical protein
MTGGWVGAIAITGVAAGTDAGGRTGEGTTGAASAGA